MIPFEIAYGSYGLGVGHISWSCDIGLLVSTRLYYICRFVQGIWSSIQSLLWRECNTVPFLAMILSPRICLCFPIRIAPVIGDQELRDRVVENGADGRDTIVIRLWNRPVINVHVAAEDRALIAAAYTACCSSDRIPINRVGAPSIEYST